MGAQLPGGSPFDLAIRSIRSIVRTLQPQDRAMLLYGDAIDTSFRPSSVTAILSALDGASPLPIRDQLSFAVQRAEQVLKETGTPFRAIVCFSDGIGSTDSLAHPPLPDISYFRWTPPDTSGVNFAIAPPEQIEPMSNRENGVLFAVTVRSFASTAETVPVKLSTGSVSGSLLPTLEQSIELPAGGTKKIEWLVKPQGNGPWRIRAEITRDDVLAIDNQAETILSNESNFSVSIEGASRRAYQFTTRHYCRWNSRFHIAIERCDHPCPATNLLAILPRSGWNESRRGNRCG